MKTYRIEVTETLKRVIDIEAESTEEALSLVRKQYKSEDIVLDANDFVSYSIDLLIDLLKTKQLVQLLRENPCKLIEANIQSNNLNATHFIILENNEIIDEGIDGEKITWQIDEFINEYHSTYWVIDYLLNDINI
ncbi:MAG: DpnD/PcfM family protein [Bacteroidales bacterium]|nr:DpnD/PcfM family protein [Bacteroidales bacterium]MDD4684336.1 DpnD/PcfM family protein [Bacteroidales bacterium]